MLKDKLSLMHREMLAMVDKSTFSEIAWEKLNLRSLKMLSKPKELKVNASERTSLAIA